MERALLKSTFVRSLLTTILLWTGLSAYALKDGDNFTFEGVKYIVISEAEKTCKALRLSDSTVKDLILPSAPNGYKLIGISTNAFSQQTALTSVTIPQGVMTIGESAFYNCTNLVSVIMPQGLTFIGERAFQNCILLSTVDLPQGLTSIEAVVFSNCTSLTSVTIPQGVTSIGHNAFNNCTSLSAVTIPHSVTSIGNSAFSKCTSLTSLTIPESVSSIGSYSFEGCTSLASVTLPQSITSIEAQTFEGCTSLTSINIPPSVSSIGIGAFRNCVSLASVTLPQSLTSICNSAFSDCFSLTTLTIPESVNSMESYVFSGCTLNPLIFEGLYTTPPDYSLLKKLSDKSVVLCRLYSLDAIRHSGFDKVYSFDSMYDFSIETLYFGCKVSIKDNPYCTTTCSNYKISIQDKEGNVVTGVDLVEPGTHEVSGLQPGTYYNAVISWLTDGIQSSYTLPFQTRSMEADTEINRTCTSITIKAIVIDGLDAKVTDKGIIYDGEKHSITGGKRFIIDNLYPNESVSYTVYVIYNDGKDEYKRNESRTTEKFSGSIECKATPTTANLYGSLGNMSDITPDRMWWDIGSQKDVLKGETVTLISLDPESKTNVSFNFTYTPKGRETRQYAVNGEIKTPALELKTLQPKCVSESCAIVAASTNMSDDEVGAGFEWKKYDAPASLTPSSGSAVVCDGMLEGYIRNLQPTSYYNVRAYYKNAAGKYWYGDWVTFDPSDFSYFEPTVRTYPAEDITSSSAKVRGYALPGTDPFHSQGFQYWKTGSISSRKITSAESGITTVIATGQIMTATFDDLEPDTQYSFRVFVETEQGFTYGDEQTFTTDTDTGVDTINDNFNEANIIGYYNLMGVRSDRPHKGINIIVYSNGQTKKTRY